MGVCTRWRVFVRVEKLSDRSPFIERLLMIKICQAAYTAVWRDRAARKVNNISRLLRFISFYSRDCPLSHIQVRVESGSCGFKSWK